MNNPLMPLIKNPCHICNWWTPENGCDHYLPDSRTVLEAAGYTVVENQGRFTVRKGKEIHRYKSIALAADVLIHSKAKAK